jgi:hypothetical protein
MSIIVDQKPLNQPSTASQHDIAKGYRKSKEIDIAG